MIQSVHKKLESHSVSSKVNGIQALFDSDSTRAEDYSFEASSLYFDFSKTFLDKFLIETYLELAEKRDFKQLREDFFSGKRINLSEDRAVLHTALRTQYLSNSKRTPRPSDLELNEALQSKQRFEKVVGQIRAELDERENRIKDIIHVGIGGSALGTQLVFDSLRTNSTDINVHFLGNIDGHALERILSCCDPKTTLVIAVSKTFTTSETLQNIASIGCWFTANSIEDYMDRVIAVSASKENALNFGVFKKNIAVFPEWVGGRYSVWSAVSLSAAVALDQNVFEEFLQGAAAIDEYFYNTALNANVCFLAAAIDHYNVNFLGAGSKAVFAYDSRLRFLVDYLQQLETESNGKDRSRDGLPLSEKSSPVVWGGVGTDVQHSVFQLLHQGTEIVPSEFVLVANADHGFDVHHLELLANGLAQSAALLKGQSLAEVEQIYIGKEISKQAKLAKVFSGNRPSTTIVLDRLTPRNLGALLAFYEHRTFCFGILCGINSYDQMGVELGKRLAKSIRPIVDKMSAAQRQKSKVDNKSNTSIIDDDVLAEFDQSTVALLRRIFR